MEESLDVMKTRFNEEMYRLKLAKGKNTQLFTLNEYYSLLNKVRVAKDKIAHKTPEDYQRLSRYDIVMIGTVQRLIVPMKNETDPIQYYCFLEETFDIIHFTHISIGHGGRNKMMKELKKKYKNITKEFVVLYLSLCEPCQKKLNVHSSNNEKLSGHSSNIEKFCGHSSNNEKQSRYYLNNEKLSRYSLNNEKLSGHSLNNEKLSGHSLNNEKLRRHSLNNEKLSVPMKEVEVKPVQSDEFNSRCEVNLINMQSQADDDFNFIMVYQDQLTKFVILRPLKSEQPKEVAYHLLDIFTIFGPPCILHSDNGEEFANKVIKELSQMWNEVKIVYDPNSQFQGPVERANIEKMLFTWMETHKTTKWSEGLRFVQFMKNRAYTENDRSPYEAMFGCKAQVGLNLVLPAFNGLPEIGSEEDMDILEDGTSGE